jgi:hypothetical protein
VAAVDLKRLVALKNAHEQMKLRIAEEEEQTRQRFMLQQQTGQPQNQPQQLSPTHVHRRHKTPQPPSQPLAQQQQQQQQQQQPQQVEMIEPDEVIELGSVPQSQSAQVWTDSMRYL